MQKTFIGTQLRQLRRDHGQTQVEMGRVLGVSAAYINLLEKNQRSLSVPVLMALADHYNVDWRDVVMDKSANILADLRNAIQDPLFAGSQPDIQELRAAIDHAPSLVQNFLKLHQSHRTAMDNIMRLVVTACRLNCLRRHLKRSSIIFFVTILIILTCLNGRRMR